MLLGFFPSNYKTVFEFSQVGEVTYAETQKGGPTSKIVGEFAASVGFSSLNFPILKEVIAFVDDYLNTGILHEERMKEIRRKIMSDLKPLIDLIPDYQKAGLADENARGAPLVLLVPAYANGLLLACDVIDKTMSGWDKTRTLKLCNERKLRDPGDEPPRKNYG